MSERLERHARIARHLAGLDDPALGSGSSLGYGIGGQTARLETPDGPAFVKRVPLTDLERQTRSTANLFGLPLFYQYGVGSAGFGAWRELAAHETTTGWVLDGTAECFPLLHHWRVLPAVATPNPLANLYGGHPAVRGRLDALAAATASLVLVLEYLPVTLHAWLADGSYDRAERELLAGTAFMRDHGMVHFDAHPHNVLADDDRFYFADLGLALLDSFELTAEEAAFLALHRDWDRFDMLRYLAKWQPRRHEPVVTLMNDFYGQLVADAAAAVYPREALLRAGRAPAPGQSPSPR